VDTLGLGDNSIRLVDVVGRFAYVEDIFEVLVSLCRLLREGRVDRPVLWK